MPPPAPARQFRLGVDLDGVVADYIAGLRETVAAARGGDPSELTLDVDWELTPWGLGPGDYLAHHNRFVADGGYLRLDPLPGAVEALHRLAAAGVLIRIVTHRGFHRPQVHRSLADTIQWLHDHQVPYDEFCAVEGKTEVECDLHIDDAPHHIAAFHDAGRPVVVFDAPWNRHVDDRGLRVRNWAEAEAATAARARSHKDALESR